MEQPGMGILDSLGLTPYLGLAIMLGMLSGVIFFARSILASIVGRIARFFSHHLEVSYTAEQFHLFMRWLHFNRDSMKFVRDLKPHHEDGKHMLVPGYGTSLIVVKGHPWVLLKRERQDNSKATHVDPDIIHFYFVTRDKSRVQAFFEEVTRQSERVTPELFQLDDGWWERIGEPKKVLEPLGEGARDFMADVEKFLDCQSEYERRGLPFKRGYLLYGPPGTGKSSLVAYLSWRFNMSVYVADAMTLTKAEAMITRVQSRSIVLIEDIDLHGLGRRQKMPSRPRPPKRRSPGRKYPPGPPVAEGEEDDGDEEIGVSRTPLQVLLNMLDGMCNYHGSVFVCTTNDRSALDPALLRPGRIDRQIYMGDLPVEDQIAHYERFFDVTPLETGASRPMTFAELQFSCVSNMDDPEAAATELGLALEAPESLRAA